MVKPDHRFRRRWDRRRTSAMHRQWSRCSALRRGPVFVPLPKRFKTAQCAVLPPMVKLPITPTRIQPVWSRDQTAPPAADHVPERELRRCQDFMCINLRIEGYTRLSAVHLQHYAPTGACISALVSKQLCCCLEKIRSTPRSCASIAAAFSRSRRWRVKWCGRRRTSSNSAIVPRLRSCQMMPVLCAADQQSQS